MVSTAKEALYKAIEKMYAGNRLGDVSYAIQNYVEMKGFSVVREFVGHGIGTSLHEPPEVPNFGIPNTGIVLEKGLVVCIEPMVNAGTWEVKVKSDNWTVVTRDGKPSAHFEHQVAITDNGPLILTEL